MSTLPGRLVMAQHLRHDIRAVDAVEIMLRYVPTTTPGPGGRRAGLGTYVICLDGKVAERVPAKWEKRDGIPSFAYAAYDRMDEIAGYRLADHRGHATDFDAAMAAGR